jgi:hypothetical protein
MQRYCYSRHISARNNAICKKQRRTVQYGAALFFARGQEFCRVRICCKLLTCIPIPLYKL